MVFCLAFALGLVLLGQVCGAGKGQQGQVVAAELELLFNDTAYGTVNRLIAKDVGGFLSNEELAVQLKTLNDLAKKAEITPGKLLSDYRAAAQGLKAKGVAAPALPTLSAVAGNISTLMSLQAGKNIMYLTACTGMCGNGVRIGTPPIRKETRPTLSGLRRAKSAWCGAGVG